MSKIRILHVLVQPVLVIEDDNGEFEPGPPMEPQQVKLSQVVDLPESLQRHVAGLQAELDKALAGAP